MRSVLLRDMQQPITIIRRSAKVVIQAYIAWRIILSPSPSRV